MAKVPPGSLRPLLMLECPEVMAPHCDELHGSELGCSDADPDSGEER